MTASFIPANTPCPDWCELPAGHGWEHSLDTSEWERRHTRNLDPDGGSFWLGIYECADPDGTRNTEWTMPGDVDRAFVDIGELAPQQDIHTAANLAIGLSDAVALAVGQMGCTEDTPAIRLVLAQRAVLDAVREMANGRAGQNHVIAAYERLMEARAATGSRVTARSAGN